MLDITTMSRILDRLEKQGLILRERIPVAARKRKRKETTEREITDFFCSCASVNLCCLPGKCRL